MKITVISQFPILKIISVSRLFFSLTELLLTGWKFHGIIEGFHKERDKTKAKKQNR